MSVIQVSAHIFSFISPATQCVNHSQTVYLPEKKKKSFLADILKCSPKVILILLHLQCGCSHDVQHSSERPQFKLPHLFFHALLKHLSFTVTQED